MPTRGGNCRISMFVVLTNGLIKSVEWFTISIQRSVTYNSGSDNPENKQC